MCCFFSLLLLLASAAVVHSNVVNYSIHDLNDNEVNECVERAMEYLMDETCLFFRKSEEHESPVTFLQSTHCAWQASNRTVHLGPSCISEDTCLNLLASMLDANFPRHQIVTQINLRYNCTEKCTTVCEHGGELRDDCTCKCEYGFTGQRCENLARESSFTDSSCGIVDSKASGGVVSLSTFPDSRPKITFCQWLIKTDDAWGLVDAEIEVLGLDDVNVSPDQNCNDRLNFYGTKDVKGTIPCDGSRNITHVRSSSNWLLVELRSDPFSSSSSFTGPKIRYNIIRAPSAVRVFSEGMTASATTNFVSLFALFVVAAFL